MCSGALAMLTIAAVAFQSAANAQCPQVNAMYRDLETWVHTPGPDRHYVVAQVTIVNPAASGGSHFYTAWSMGCFSQGVMNYGQCYLTSNPTLPLLFSDRKGASSIPQATQPFTLGEYDNHLVALDMVRNRLISKSRTWNYEKVYAGLTRKGNLIYGVHGDGSMIALNLVKRKTQGPAEPLVCGW